MEAIISEVVWLDKPMDDDDECFDVVAVVTDLKANCSKRGPYSSLLLLMDLLMQWLQKCREGTGGQQCFIPISITKNTIAPTTFANTLLDEHGDEDNHMQNVQ